MATTANVDALLAQCEWVRNLVRHLVFDRDVADDVVQQTYLAALEHAPPELESPRGWLAKVARRFAWQAHRKDARRRRHEPLAARAEAVPAAHDVDRRIELHRSLVDAVSALPEQYRAIVVMRYFEGRAPRDIAARLGLPATTVRNRLSRALEQLRSRFDRQYGDRRTWALAMLPLSLGRARVVGTAAAGAAAAALLAVAIVVVGVWPAARAAGTRRFGDRPASPRDGGGAPSAPATASVAPLAAPVEPRAPARAALRGRVVDREGVPAPGARVSILDPLRRRPNADDWFTRSSRQFEPTAPVAEAVADASGSFSVAELAPGAHDLMAEAPGAARALAEDVATGPGSPDVTLVLDPVELVRCVAVGEEGAPVPDADVAVHHQKSFDPHFNRPRTELIRSDAAGRFSIARARGDLVDARLVFVERFQGAGCWQQVSLRKAGYTPVFAAPLSQQQIDEDGRVVFVLRRGRRFTISFRSEDTIDEPLRCMLRIDSARYEAVTTTDENQDAIFEDVPEGTIASLILDAPGWALMRKPAVDGLRSRFCAGRYKVPAGRDVRWEVPIHRGAAVGGIVVDEATGAPVQGVEVVAFPNAGYLASRSHLVRGVSGADGRFALTGVTAVWTELRLGPGEWHARSPSPGPSMPEAPETGLPEIATPPPIVATRRSAALALLVLPDPDEPIRDLRIGVRRAGRACGAVVDAEGRPVAGARVSVAEAEGEAALLWPPPADDLAPGAAVTDASGAFALGGVPPGTVRIVARAPGCGPSVSAAFELQPAGEARVAPIVVKPGEPLVVTVRSDQGRPVAGVGVKIYAGRFPREQEGPDDVAARTDACGRVEVRSLPAGPICLAVENATSSGLILAPSFRSTYSHDPSRREEIAVEMVESAPLRGVVRTSDGAPVSHATVVLAPASISPDDFRAVEDLIGRGTLDWGRLGTEAQIREISGVRVRTDAAGAFAVGLNTRRPFVVRRVERWRRGDPDPAATFEPADAGAVLVPGGAETIILVRPSPGSAIQRR